MRLHVRRIKRGDIEEVISLGINMHNEGDFRAVSFSGEKVEKIFNLCIDSDKYSCFIAMDNEKIVGFYACILAQEWFSNDLVSKDMALYVIPEYRSKGIAKILIKEYMKWSEKNKVIVIGAGTNSGINSDGVKKLYESFGFTTVGYVFRKRN